MRVSRPRARLCRKPSCRVPAAATLAFHYDTAHVVILPLVDEEHPTRWDLCDEHADGLVVPSGWGHTDHRAAPPAARPPVGASGGDRSSGRTSAAERRGPPTAVPVRSSAAADGRADTGRGRRSRYAELMARLPEIAATHRGGGDPDTDVSENPAATGGDTRSDAAGARAGGRASEATGHRSGSSGPTRAGNHGGAAAHPDAPGPEGDGGSARHGIAYDHPPTPGRGAAPDAAGPGPTATGPAGRGASARDVTTPEMTVRAVTGREDGRKGGAGRVGRSATTAVAGNGQHAMVVRGSDTAVPPDVAALATVPEVPGQLRMALPGPEGPGAGDDAADGPAGRGDRGDEHDDEPYPRNVVPLLRPGGVLDPVP